mmetsp:Transcript_93307/g.170927  ORF Transcript_93307/g.170927 Transcript_93307/m.170927 type:complete len:462 (-) Transcript_93307:126-1511(-)
MVLAGRGDSVPSERVETEWLWEALFSCRHAYHVIMQLAPDDFDWNAMHPVHGTPLMATVNEIVRSGQVNRDVRSVLQWVIKHGADPRRIAPTARGYSGGWGNSTDEFPNVPRVPHNGKSAITLVLGLINVLERIWNYEHKGKYQDQLSAAKELMNIFGRFRENVPTSPVPCPVLEMWQNIQYDQEHADVEIHVTGDIVEDDCTSQDRDDLCIIRAHSLVLCHASPVLEVFLSNRWSASSGEGGGPKMRTVPLPGASPVAVHLLLETIYTGVMPAQPSSRRPPRGGWSAGDAVEANWRGKGRWWPARIKAVDNAGLYNITYDGDASESYAEQRVEAHCLRQPRVQNASNPGGSTAVDYIQTQLIALDIAHRWQVSHAVRLLEESLASQMREGPLKGWFSSNRDWAPHMRTFEQLCEAANLKDLPVLRAACRHFASMSEQVRRQFECADLGATTMRELKGVFD